MYIYVNHLALASALVLIHWFEPAILASIVRPLFCGFIQSVWLVILQPWFPAICLGQTVAEICADWQFIGMSNLLHNLLWCNNGSWASN
jgi:hypothetical protein